MNKTYKLTEEKDIARALSFVDSCKNSEWSTRNGNAVNFIYADGTSSLHDGAGYVYNHYYKMHEYWEEEIPKDYACDKYAIMITWEEKGCTLSRAATGTEIKVGYRFIASDHPVLSDMESFNFSEWFERVSTSKVSETTYDTRLEK